MSLINAFDSQKFKVLLREQKITISKFYYRLLGATDYRGSIQNLYNAANSKTEPSRELWLALAKTLEKEPDFFLKKKLTGIVW